MNIQSRLLTICLAAAALCTLAAASAQAAVVSTSYSNTTPVAICDLCTVTSVLNVSTHGRVLDIDALIDITHSYNNDLTISLSHGGTSVLLSNRQGGSGGANYTNTVFDDQAGVSIDAGWAYAPYTGSFRPQEALVAFLDRDVFGLWTLVVTDHEAGDNGSINRFGLGVVAEAAAEVPEPGSLALFGAALAGFTGVSRTARARTRVR
ncbi:proprotein convertase P-domain-containing protein [Massilia niabensis]|uniref:Proprotein convertase P-domain-containing protein n=1 Tax=Massilia niabensis TaxID=544910 RepID=A0ABW0LAW5_9BURK